MPDSPTQIKGPATEAGRRLLGQISAVGDPDFTDDVLAIEADATAAERAFWEEALKHGHWRYQDLLVCQKDDLCSTKADGAELVLGDIQAFLDAREP